MGQLIEVRFAHSVSSRFKQGPQNFELVANVNVTSHGTEICRGMRFFKRLNGESEFEGTSNKLSQSDPQKLRGKKGRNSTRSAVPKHSINKEPTRWAGGKQPSNIIRRGNFLIGWWVFSSTTVEFGRRPCGQSPAHGHHSGGARFTKPQG